MTRFLNWLFRRRPAPDWRPKLNPMLLALHMDQASNQTAMR